MACRSSGNKIAERHADRSAKAMKPERGLRSFRDGESEVLYGTGKGRRWLNIAKVALRSWTCSMRRRPWMTCAPHQGTGWRNGDGEEYHVSHVRIRTHLGEVLREEYMTPLGLSATALARALRVPPNRITSIMAKEKPRAVTSDTALRLARFFSTSPQFWLNLQTAYDLSLAEATAGAKIEKEIQPLAT
jgi:addiction module HigA family antidote